MPQAISGGEDAGGYSFTVKATSQQVQEFYDREMPLAGWQPFAVGTGESGNLLLLYQKDGAITTIGVIAQGEIILVLIVQT